MLPQDAYPGDWRMYYNGCWMHHRELGYGLVSVTGQQFYLTDLDDIRREVDYHDLSIWWPKAASRNTGAGRAVWIERKASRTMRKSACSGEHYRVRWGSLNHFCGLKYCELGLLARKAKPVSTRNGYKAIANDLCQSIAITDNIILSKAFAPGPDDGLVDVVFRGIEVGKFDGRSLLTVNDYPLVQLVAKEMGVGSCLTMRL